MVEQTRLVMAYLEIWRGHYEQTLRHWQARFRSHERAVLAMLNVRFVRMWWRYLISAEVSFSHYGHVRFRMQLSYRADAVPATRDHL